MFDHTWTFVIESRMICIEQIVSHTINTFFTSDVQRSMRWFSPHLPHLGSSDVGQSFAKCPKCWQLLHYITYQFTIIILQGDRPTTTLSLLILSPSLRTGLTEANIWNISGLLLYIRVLSAGCWCVLLYCWRGESLNKLILHYQHFYCVLFTAISDWDRY